MTWLFLGIGLVAVLAVVVLLAVLGIEESVRRYERRIGQRRSPPTEKDVR